MQVSEVFETVESIAPLRGACSWDRSGIQIAGRTQECHRVALALDPIPEIMEEALEWGAEVVVTHHPLTMEPRFLDKPNSFNRIAASFLSRGAWLYAAHTSLDANPKGPVGWLARSLNLQDAQVLEVTDVDDFPLGLGIAGDLPEQLPREAFLGRLAEAVRRDYWMVTGTIPETVRRIAYCTGSGSSLISSAADAGAEVFITGDMKYHAALDAALPVIDVGHFSLEEEMTRLLAEFLRENLVGEIEVRFFPGSDPLRLYCPDTGLAG